MQTGVKLGVLIGGPSAKYELSRASAIRVLAALEQLGYVVKPILVTPDHSWYVYTDRAAYEANDYHQAFGVRDAVERLPQLVDVVFIAMHGAFGEDGGVQRLLDRAGLPYQGSGVRASRLVFDKHATSQVLRRLGISVPDYTVIERSRWVVARARIIRQTVAAYGLPVVVKPNSNVGHNGAVVAHNLSELTEILELVSAQHDRVIVQRFMVGHKINCVVLERAGEAIVLPPAFIRPTKAKALHYSPKVIPKAYQLITSAPVTKVTQAVITRTALGVHRILKLQGYSQIDMILAQRQIWILKVSTLPELTEASLFSQTTAAAGIDFISLINELVRHALSRPEVVELS